MMKKLHVTDFSNDHIEQAVALDRKWFCADGASNEDFLSIFSKKDKHALVILSEDSLLKGFAVFDVLNPGEEVADYSGLETTTKTAFIQQFTTDSNYGVGNWEVDGLLLKAVEKHVAQLGCLVVWEALSKNHPYSLTKNPAYDAYGFYEANGYTVSTSHAISWKKIVPCNLLYKNLEERSDHE
jgi:hypothetical protein